MCIKHTERAEDNDFPHHLVPEARQEMQKHDVYMLNFKPHIPCS